MPPRPFPTPFTIGTDIVQISRIKQILMRQTQDRDRTPTPRLVSFLRRFLTAREQFIFHQRFRVCHDGDKFKVTQNVLQHLSGRWAAKEAVIKAVQWRELSFSEIQIYNKEPDKISGPPWALILDTPASMRGCPIHIQHAPEGNPRESVVGSYEKSLRQNSPSYRPKTGLGRTEDEYAPFEEQGPKADGQIAQVSISHEDNYATAVCISALHNGRGSALGRAPIEAIWRGHKASTHIKRLKLPRKDSGNPSPLPSSDSLDHPTKSTEEDVNSAAPSSEESADPHQLLTKEIDNLKTLYEAPTRSTEEDVNSAMSSNEESADPPQLLTKEIDNLKTLYEAPKDDKKDQ